MAGAELTFPLVPRRRLVGLAFGAMHSARRGMGSDVAGSRPYRPGDDVDTIDWYASARLSSARGTDEFVVRERYAEEAPRVVLLCDRRPEMSLFPSSLPWLSKPKAMRHAVELILQSAADSRGFVGYLDHASGEPFWQPPETEHRLSQVRDRSTLVPDFSAPSDSVAAGLTHLSVHRRSLPAGSFVFVISDFLSPPPMEAWLAALDYFWDLVPVVIQDPVWEQSFPAIDGIVVPLADPRSGKLVDVRLTASEVAARRGANERRYADLLEAFRSLDLEPVLVSSSEPGTILASFLAWAEDRSYRRGRRR